MVVLVEPQEVVAHDHDQFGKSGDGSDHMRALKDLK